MLIRSFYILFLVGICACDGQDVGLTKISVDPASSDDSDAGAKSGSDGDAADEGSSTGMMVSDDQRDDGGATTGGQTLETHVKDMAVTLRSSLVLGADTLEAQAAALPASMNQLPKSVTTLAEPLQISIKDDENNVKGSIYDLTLAIPQTGVGLVENTIQKNLCVLLQPASQGKPIVFRPELVKVEDYNATVKTLNLGIFVLARCGHIELPGFDEAKWDGSVGKQIKEWGKPISPLANAVVEVMKTSSTGKIWVGGSVSTAGGGSDFLAMNLLSEGSLDPSFNRSGYVVVDNLTQRLAPDLGHQALALVITASGKGLFGGASAFSAGDDRCPLLVQFLPSGARDNSFAPGGVKKCDKLSPVDPFQGRVDVDSRLADLAFAGEYTYGVFRSKGDKIPGRVVDVARFKRDGTFDSTYSDPAVGFYRFQMRNFDLVSKSITLDKYRRLYICATGIGANSSVGIVLRLKSDGSVDNSFGPDGQFRFSQIPDLAHTSRCSDIYYDESNGRVVVTGQGGKDATAVHGIILALKISTGKPDVNFGQTKGYSMVPSSSSFVNNISLVRDRFGRIYTIGNITSTVSAASVTVDSIVTRFTNQGLVDTSWQNGGTFTFLNEDIQYRFNVGAIDHYNRLIIGGEGFFARP